MNEDGGRLAEATAVAFRHVVEMGYRIESRGSSGRGEAVDVIGDVVRISISADWLEGEIEVELQALGHTAVPLDSVVNLGQVHGLHLRRISRTVTRDQLVSTLTKVADALVAQAPEVLAQTPDGVARLGTRDDMRRYRVVVVDHSGEEFVFVALTTGGKPKAAYMAGSAFEAMHPRTGIATFRIVEATGRRRDTDLIDRMEW